MPAGATMPPEAKVPDTDPIVAGLPRPPGIPCAFALMLPLQGVLAPSPSPVLKLLACARHLPVCVHNAACSRRLR